MFATIRQLKTQPDKVAEVARLIESEYVPIVEAVDGFVSYTLVQLASDEVGSLGVFSTSDAAAEANNRAQEWVKDRLGPLIASPLHATAGEVLLTHPAV